MRLFVWLAKIAEGAFSNASANKGISPDVTVRLEVHSHEVTDDESASIKAERKQKAKEWRALGKDEQKKRMREKFRGIAETNRKQAVSLGITHYIWLWPNTPECDVGMRNNGKTFSFLDPPSEGHPCEGLCHAKDWCRCAAKPIIPKFL